MNLPKDTNNWTEAHLERATIECDNAFARYEARVDRDVADPVSNKLYADYQRKAARVDDLLRVVKGATR